MSAATIPSAGGNCVPSSEAIWLCAITKAIAPKSRAVSKLARVRSARAVRSTTANTSKKRTFVTRRTSSAALIHTLRPKLASNKHRQRQCQLAGVPVAHAYQLTEAEVVARDVVRECAHGERNQDSPRGVRIRT